MVRVKKSLTGVEVESDLPEIIAEKYTEKDKEVLRAVVENQGSTTSEISNSTGIPRNQVDYSLNKLEEGDAIAVSRKKNIKRWFVDNKETVAIVLGISLLAVVLLMQGAKIGGLVGEIGRYEPKATMEGSPEGQQALGIASPVVRESEGAGVGGLFGLGRGAGGLVGGAQDVAGSGAAASGLGIASPTTFGGQDLSGEIITGAGGQTIYQPVAEQRYTKTGWFSPSLGDIRTGGQTGTIVGSDNILQQQEQLGMAGYINVQQAQQEALRNQGLTQAEIDYLRSIGAV